MGAQDQVGEGRAIQKDQAPRRPAGGRPRAARRQMRDHRQRQDGRSGKVLPDVAGGCLGDDRMTLGGEIARRDALGHEAGGFGIDRIGDDRACKLGHVAKSCEGRGRNDVGQNRCHRHDPPPSFQDAVATGQKGIDQSQGQDGRDRDDIDEQLRRTTLDPDNRHDRPAIIRDHGEQVDDEGQRRQDDEVRGADAGDAFHARALVTRERVGTGSSETGRRGGDGGRRWPAPAPIGSAHSEPQYLETSASSVPSAWIAARPSLKAATRSSPFWKTKPSGSA